MQGQIRTGTELLLHQLNSVPFCLPHITTSTSSKKKKKKKNRGGGGDYLLIKNHKSIQPPMHYGTARTCSEQLKQWRTIQALCVQA